MRDLVETVIDSILVRERMQQAKIPHASRATTHRQPGSPVPGQSQPHVAGTQLSQSSRHENKELWHASLQFEAIFIQQMMTSMRKTVPKSEFTQQGFAEDVHGSMMDAAIAQASAKHGSMGIAESLYRQMEATQGVSAQGISNAADRLEMPNNLVMEASKYAR